jgi:hypothetical protein
MTNSDGTDPSDDEVYARFELVRQWPEQLGSLAWRKRAAREMSPPEIEWFFHDTLQLEDLGEAERTSIFQKLEHFNAARGRRSIRKRLLSGLIEGMDALGGIFSLFGFVGLVGLVFAPGLLDDPYFALWMYFHWGVALVWAVSLVIRLPKFIRDWRTRRAGDKIDFHRMKQEVVYVDGRFQQGEYVPKSADEIAMDKTIGWGLNVFFAFTLIGFAGAIHEPNRVLPFWLAIVLMILGVIGALLLVRVQTLAERMQGEWDRDRARAKAAASAPVAL